MTSATHTDPVLAALLRAVVTEPFDDGHRLVLADRLEEADTELSRARATLIRWQIETGIGFTRYREKWIHAEARYRREVYRKRPAIMYIALNNFLSEFLPGDIVVDRGFVSRVSCTLQAWLDQGHEIVLQQPVTEVLVTDREPYYGGHLSGTRRYFWFCDEWGDGRQRYPSHELPRELYYIDKPDRVVRYYSGQDARADLSRKCVALARHRAGLPPLTWPGPA